uniref:TATA box-binding protein-like 1 n=1 Tax=Trypanosoma congolense (strain IL3000) TaxID=1068625 RepID=G0UYX6_TRYCI|nr:putative TFIID-like protein [Trypanosoma congolense IL3000]
MDDDFNAEFDMDENDFFMDEAEGGMDYENETMGIAGLCKGTDSNVAEGTNGTEVVEEPSIRVSKVNIQDLFPRAKPDTVPVVVGIIAQAKLGVGVDLRALSCATRNVEFAPRLHSPSATLRLHDPNAVVQVRTSGLLGIIGASSVGEARQATELAARIIRKALNLNFSSVQFRVRSLMARFEVGHPIRLDDLAHHKDVFCSYEPDRFSGCIMRLSGKSSGNKWEVCCNVYVTGKVNILGARSQEELMDAFYTVLPILALYAKK